MADDDVREEFAVGASARESGGGKVRLVLDDLRLVEGAPDLAWKQWSYYTDFELEAEALERGELDRAELEAIGRAVVVRLAALRAAARED